MQTTREPPEPPGGRPAVLFVTGHLPYPPVSGGRRRESELIRRLANRFAFHLFVSSKTYEEDLANAHRMLDLCESVQVWPAGVAHPASYPRGVPSLVRSIWSPDMAAGVDRALLSGGIDVVHVERFHLLPHVPPTCEPPILLVEQNIEYALWAQRLALALSARERKRRLREYLVTLRSEIEAWHRATMCGVVTEEDRSTMRAAIPGLDVRIIPHGVEPSSPPSRPSPDPPALGLRQSRGLVVFVGNFGYGPNVDGAIHLCRDIFPKVRVDAPEALLVLVGNDPPPEVQVLASENVVVTGRVASVEPYLNAADVVVCPLREGGGIKVKLLEALARGKPVVSTSLGARGFGPRTATAMRIEDRPRRFARAIAELLHDPALRARLGTAGRELVASFPTWDDSAASLGQCYEDLVAGGLAATRKAGRAPTP